MGGTTLSSYMGGYPAQQQAQQPQYWQQFLQNIYGGAPRQMSYQDAASLAFGYDPYGAALQAATQPRYTPPPMPPAAKPTAGPDAGVTAPAGGGGGEANPENTIASGGGQRRGGRIGHSKDVRAAMLTARRMARDAGGETPGTSHAQMARSLGKVKSTSIGQMVGRYQNMSAERAHRLMYGDLYRLAIEGHPGKEWYENSSKSILNHVNGDINEADKFAQLIAIYSPQTSVPTNTQNAIKAYNRAKAGHAIWNGQIIDKDRQFKSAKEANEYLNSLGGSKQGYTKIPLEGANRFLIAKHGNIKDYENIATMDRDLKAHLVMNEDVPFEGRKINNFYNNLMVHIDPSRLQGSTQDLWMARAFGFLNDAVGGGEKYNYMEQVTQRLAKELGWRPHQVQAAIWTAIKTRQEAVENEVKKMALERGIARMGVNPQTGKPTFQVNDGMDEKYATLMRNISLGANVTPEQIAESAKDFSHFLKDNLAHVAWESAPGVKSRHLEGFDALPPEAKAEYHVGISKALQDENGNDRLAQYLGMLSPGAVESPGYWEGASNPATHQLISSTRIKAAGQSPKIDEPSKHLMDIYSDALGFLLKQDGVAYHRPYFNPQVSKANGLEYAFKDVDENPLDLSHDHIVHLGKMIDTHVPGAALVPVGGHKVRVINFGYGGDDQREFHKAMDSVVNDATIPGAVAHKRIFASDGNVRSNNWEAAPYGEDYRSRLSAAGRSDVLGHMASAIAPKIEAFDNEFASKYGLGRNTQLEAAIRNPFAGQPAQKQTGGGVFGPAITQALGLQGTAEARLSRRGQLPGSQGGLSTSSETGGPLEGLPKRVKIPGVGHIEPAPDHRIRAIAHAYMTSNGLPYNPPTKYVKVDKDRAQRIAAAFQNMKHDPHHPDVRASYEALAKETLHQYNFAKKHGFKAEFWDPSKVADPYAASPRLANEDIKNNNHLYVFPTMAGYGTGEISQKELNENPLLAHSGETWGGQPVLINDIFRAVHDYFGHAKEGVGFRHDGEENAWRSHAAMFSPLARKALTTETRGQNSWVNFGPHGPANQTASTENTKFADQKIGLMPDWTSREGAEDFLLYSAGGGVSKRHLLTHALHLANSLNPVIFDPSIIDIKHRYKRGGEVGHYADGGDVEPVDEIKLIPKYKKGQDESAYRKSVEGFIENYIKNNSDVFKSYNQQLEAHNAARPAGYPRQDWYSKFSPTEQGRANLQPEKQKIINLAKNAIEQSRKRNTALLKKAAFSDIKTALEKHGDVINSIHKNQNLDFTPMELSHFNESNQNNLNVPGIKIHKSPSYNGRQSSEYKLIMYNGEPVYARKSNHWGYFNTNVTNPTEAAGLFNMTEDEAREMAARDPFGRIGKKTNIWTLGGRSDLPNVSQAGYIPLSNFIKKNITNDEGSEVGPHAHGGTVDQALALTRQYKRGGAVEVAREGSHVARALRLAHFLNPVPPGRLRP
jgi:hypothetical protein